MTPSLSVSSRTVNLMSVRPEDYVHSPVHYAIALGDHALLTHLLSTLPKLGDPEQIRTVSDSLYQERVANQISALLDRCDVPSRATPLHLAVRLDDLFAATAISSAGADISLQNAAGWNPLQEAFFRRNFEVTEVLLRHHHRLAWCKWRRRLPRLIEVLRSMQDFYMEIFFNFESVIPFVGKIAPSDTYKIWKRDGNLRADITLAGYDEQRVDQSLLFLGEGDTSMNISAGSFLVVNRDDRIIKDAFESDRAPITDFDIAKFCSKSRLKRPEIDVTNAELVERTNRQRQAKMKTVGEWNARVYEIQGVTFSLRLRKSVRCTTAAPPPQPQSPRRSGARIPKPSGSGARIPKLSGSVAAPSTVAPMDPSPSPKIKEKEIVKRLHPSVWLTDQFPLTTEELLPLLDILAIKVKAVAGMRDLLTTNSKFPPGTFPFKLSIPIPMVPTVKVAITFTKFVITFYTPPSSPLVSPEAATSVEDESVEAVGQTEFVELPRAEQFYTSPSRPVSGEAATSVEDQSEDGTRTDSRNSITRPSQERIEEGEQQTPDPFAIPIGYTFLF